MSVVSIELKGNFDSTENWLARAASGHSLPRLDKYGQMGVQALSSATPSDSGKTASSWNYRVKRGRGSVTIEWTNSNINKGVPIAIILQYGHGTGTGGYVQGRDYINPAMRPVFDKIAAEAFREVSNG